MPHADQDVAKIRQALGHRSADQHPRAWLDTGITELNEVLGRADLGLPYGRLIEVSGLESQAKTAISFVISAIGQAKGAKIIWVDLETSFDDDWSRKRGLDPTKVQLFQPYVGSFGKEKGMRLSNAVELCNEAEAGIRANFKKGSHRMIVVVDSIASMLTEDEADGGLERTLPGKMALPVFLTGLMRRWVGTAQAYNALIIFINQMRQNPMQRFGTSWYTPGGNAARFYCHVRARTKAVQGGKIKRAGRTIGFQGILTNFKNKIGGRRDSAVGYRLFFDGPMEFCPIKDLTEEKDPEED